MQSLAIIYPLQHYQLKQLHNPYLPTNAWLAERVLTDLLGVGERRGKMDRDQAKGRLTPVPRA